MNDEDLRQIVQELKQILVETLAILRGGSS